MNGGTKRMKVGRLSVASILILLLPSFLFFAACGSDGGDGTIRVIDSDASAAAGGTFRDNPVQPTFTLTIPPGALSTDAHLTVDILGFPPGSDPNQTETSRSFSVTLSGVGVALIQPMQIEMVTNTSPVPPQICQVAVLNGLVREPLSASFFRPTDLTAVGLTTETIGVFQVVIRNVPAPAGPAVAAGFDVFLNETFGNESFFGDVVELHTLLNNTIPSEALALGVQVDLNKVPADIVAVMTGVDLLAKDVALDNPVITQRLIKAGAVIGVKGFYATALPDDITLVQVGITCALCHVNVTPTVFSLTDGPTLLSIGPMEANGVPNTRLDAGAILALTPLVAASPATATLLNGWGPGAFDIRFDLSALQGSQLNPLEDLVDNPTSNPPIWNFISLEQQGYLFGWDGLFQNNGITNNALASQAEAVYDLVMHANGAFGTPGGNIAPELRIAPPPDLVAGLEAAEAPLTGQPGNFIDTGKLLEVQTWMRSLVSPPPGPFNETLAQQGFTLFHGRAQCNVCHQTEHFTGPGLFTDITATPPSGGLADGIKVPGLKGISRTAPYFHDHSAATLEEAVTRFVVRGDPVPLLTLDEEAALVEYLRSL